MRNATLLFAILFLLTGVFAAVGAIFTWGDGWLPNQPNGFATIFSWADLFLTTPLSCASAYGVWRQKRWGLVAGLLTCGVYLYGSVMVYFAIAQQQAAFALKLILPPVVGFGVVAAFVVWVIRGRFLKTDLSASEADA